MSTLVVDARRLYGSGIGRYVRELLPRVMGAGHFADCWVVGDPSELRPWVNDVLHGARILPLPFGRYDWRAQTGWWRLRRALPNRDVVVWYPHIDAPVALMPTPAVVTVHDLIALRVPGAVGVVRRVLFSRVLDRVVQQATLVVTVSQATADDVRAHIPSLASRLRSVPNGGAELSSIPVSSEPVPSGPYLLAVANRKPHKNHWLMVELLARLRVRGLTVRLVVVGEWYPYWESVMAHANQLGVAGAIVDEGVVSDHRLRRLYDQALACLVPSRLEGFGLPLVEAIACGAPVIASDLLWAREVGGDAVMYANPDDPDAWADIVNQLLVQPLWRAAWVARGLARAIGFTWAHSATGTAKVLREALAMGEA